MHGETDLPTASIQRLGRITGAVYLLLGLLSMFSALTFESIAEPGDAAATTGNILDARGLFGTSLVAWIGVVVADIAVSVTFYLILRPVSRTLALLAAALRLVYSAMLGVILVDLYDAYLLLTNADRAAAFDEADVPALAMSAVDSFDTGFLVALVLFGIHNLVLGYLLYRSRYLPRVIGALIVAAGVGYIVDNLASLFVADYGGPVSAILVAPAIIGEFGMALWLLVRGLNR